MLFYEYMLVSDTSQQAPWKEIWIISNRLNIEIGSFENAEINLRFCGKYDMQARGDEFDAMYICPLLGQAENKYIKQRNQSACISI